MRRPNYFIQITSAFTLTLIIGLTLVRGVSAHAYLLRSDPAANSILETAPASIKLWFSEIISQEFSSAQLVNDSGQSLDVSITVDPNDPTLMIVDLPELADGVYSLRWTAHSDIDGHFSHGLFIFGVGQEADLSTATAVDTDTAVPLPELLLRWLNFIAYAGLIGAFAVTYLVLKPRTQPEAIAAVQRTAQKRMLRLAWWCSLAALFLGAAWLGWQAYTLAQNSGGLSLIEAAWQWLTQTRLGFYWWARQIVLLGAAGSVRVLLRRERPPAWLVPLTSILLLILVLIQSLTSHAAALTPNTAVAITADTLHLLAASFWVGGLLALAVGLLPLVRRRDDFTALVKAGWRPFGKWAAASVALLFITGLYGTGREVSSANAMLTTFYGQTLLVKIGLMLVVGLFGATNAMLLHPRLAAPLARLLRKPAGWTPLSLRQFPRLLVMELALGLLVLLLAGTLTAAPTARGVAYTTAANAFSSRNQTVDDMFITLAVNPNRAGQNIFTVRAVSRRRPPPAELLRVILRLTYLEEDLGLTSVTLDEFEPDLYLLTGNQLYLPGRWQIDVVARRKGIEDSVARFEWVVPPGDPTQEPLVSDAPWEPFLTAIAAVLLGVWVTAVFWGFNQSEN